jgi:thioesterase domain-containing protein
MEPRPPPPPGFDAAELRADCRSIRDRWTSLSGYQPGPCGAVLTLFEAEERDPAIERFFDRCTPEERRTRGWCDLAPGRVEVHRVPGVHATIATEPNVRVLAERMRAALEAARARASSGPAGAR